MDLALTSSPSISIEPVTRQMGMVSFIRFMQRKNVDLPQPEGPMNEVTAFSGMSMATSNRACFSP